MTRDGESRSQRLRRLIEGVDRRLRARPRAVRAVLGLLGLALVAVLAVAAWPIVIELVAEHATATDPRPAYVDAVREKIHQVTEAALKNAPEREQPASLKVRIEVDAEGNVASLKLTESSGDADLDELALRIIRSAAPFGPFPPAMRRTTRIVELHSEFHFH